jgi:Zn-dependent M28 family amino/carboxypeptidase
MAGVALLALLLMLPFAIPSALYPWPSTVRAGTFDGQRALEHVRQLVAIGPRVAGSPGAERARDYISKEIAALGLRAEPQTFDAKTPLGLVKMVNLRVAIPADASLDGPRVILAGHFDTKLFKEFTFVGANDAGSSAAFLIEAARVLRERSLPMPIELLFLDGEEAVVEWQDDDHTYGSRHYVQAAERAGTLKNIRALILVDMIGDRDLRISREANSTPWLTETIWNTARRLKASAFVDHITPIEDDHIPFLEAGVPAVDIIDLEYTAWHTAEDTLDKVSARSLQTVGDVVMEALPEIMERVRR